MQSSKNIAIKDRITHAIFIGAAVMIIVFAISLFLPKEWLVSGKIVVFPSGQPASASVNLVAEVGNTAEIIKSESFQKANFGDQSTNFAGAKVVKNSSMVWVKFRSSENDIQVYEDLIVEVPDEVSAYARDLYGGSPFKYKMASDPEISPSPVRPNLLLNALLGFAAGFAVYLIYSAFESKKTDRETEVEEKKEAKLVSPEIKSTKPVEEKVGEGKVEMKDGRPHFAPGKKESAFAKASSGAKALADKSAPENLPFVDQSAPSADIQEPSDEEVKERLNRLMRGEL